MILKDQLLNFMQRQQMIWINGGEFERMRWEKRENVFYKPSTVSRQLRSMAEKGDIERKDDGGSVWYRWVPGGFEPIRFEQPEEKEEMQSLFD